MLRLLLKAIGAFPIKGNDNDEISFAFHRTDPDEIVTQTLQTLASTGVAMVDSNCSEFRNKIICENPFYPYHPCY